MADDYGHQLFPLIIINSSGPRNASNIDNTNQPSYWQWFPSKTHSARSRACVAEACHACQEGDVRAKAGPWPEVVAIGNRLDWDLKGKWWEGILWFVSFVFQCFFFAIYFKISHPKHSRPKSVSIHFAILDILMLNMVVETKTLV